MEQTCCLHCKTTKSLQRVLILEKPKDPANSLPRSSRTSGCALLMTGCPSQAPSSERREGDPHALASIVYTSGTTGRPKGVMLSHYNMLSVAHAALACIDCYQQDVFLSFLPLSHTLERTAGYYLPMMAGACVAHARSVSQLAEDLVTVRPTAMIAVPRIFERVHGRIMEKLDKQSVVGAQPV